MFGQWPNLVVKEWFEELFRSCNECGEVANECK